MKEFFHVNQLLPQQKGKSKRKIRLWGKILKQYREDNFPDMTQEFIAGRLGYGTRQSVNRKENGNSKIYEEELYVWLKLLNLDIAVFAALVRAEMNKPAQK